MATKDQWRDFTTNPCWETMIQDFEAIRTKETQALISSVSSETEHQIRVLAGKIENCNTILDYLRRKAEYARTPGLD